MKTIKVEKEVWKELHKIKIEEGYERISDIIEEMVNHKEGDTHA